MNNPTTSITIDKKVSAVMDEIAAQTEERLNAARVLCVNFMGSPGSGKTSVLEGLTPILGKQRISAIQGDLESDIDKRRLEAAGISTVQINTHSGCHLNARMVADALKEVDLGGRHFLFIENVGNLVCPATKNIGQHLNVLISSTTEGSDKPRKYPVIFHASQILVITKDDLAEAVGFDAQNYLADLAAINPAIKVFRTTTRRPDCWKQLAEELISAREREF